MEKKENSSTSRLDKNINKFDKNIDELEKTLNDIELKASLIYDEENYEKSDIEKKLNKRSSLKVYQIIILFFLTVIFSIIITKVVIDYNDGNLKGATSSVKTSALEEFEEVYSLIKNSYYKKINEDKLVDSAIEGMLSSLDDPHTSYFNQKETESFNDVMNGSYEGIGAEISIDNNNNIIILSVFKNSPADEAGLKFNDIILEVNDKSTKGLSTSKVVELIKDKTKPVAKIKINRDGKEMTINVEKRVVVIESVESKIYNKNGKKIGYILINTFANNTYDQFNQQLNALENNNISGLIIDVRNNSGGYLHAVTYMMDLFLPKGTVIYKIKDQKKTTEYTAINNESRNYPVAVMVNGSSASASEILAIGLKEAYGAEVIGTQSYGKGTVQTTKELSTGGMIKYTIQKWLSPKGNWINKIGVTPTVNVEMGENFINNPTSANDNQLQTALDKISK